MCIFKGGVFLGGGGGEGGRSYTLHSKVTVAVNVGFARTDDGRNHRQGATFARADNNPRRVRSSHSPVY